MSLHEQTRVAIPANAWDAIFAQGFTEFAIEPEFLAQVVPAVKEGLTRMSDTTSHHASFQKVVLGKDEMGWEQDSGLVRRSDREKKWFFHYCGGITYSHLHASGAPVHEYDEFFRALATVNARARMYASQLAKAYDKRFSCPSGPLAPRAEKSYCLTRALRYLKTQESSEPDATVHFDRGFVTPHWVSTQSGLVLFGPDGTRREAQEKSLKHVAIFPSKKFAAVTRGKHGFGTAHGVKNKLRHQTAEDRFALVSFVHIALSANDIAWLKSVEEQMEQAEKSFVM